MFGRLLSPTFLFAIITFPVLAQTQDNPPPAHSTNAAPAAAPASSSGSSATSAPKKVWTNEDMSNVKGGVSVVGDKRNQNYKVTPGQTADSATVDRIKKSLQKLQGQLDDVNAKLASYKQFLDGEPVSTGERDMSKGYSRTPVDQQIIQLENKKKDLTLQIGDLWDEARKKGIDSSQLR
jgi:hypothetical protein